MLVPTVQLGPLPLTTVPLVNTAVRMSWLHQREIALPDTIVQGVPQAHNKMTAQLDTTVPWEQETLYHVGMAPMDQPQGLHLTVNVTHVMVGFTVMEQGFQLLVALVMQV